MRFEAKTEADAVEQAARALSRPAGDVKYRVVRDEKSFWGGRIVEIEVAEPAAETPRPAAREASPEPPMRPEIGAPNADLTQTPARSERPDATTSNADLTPFGDQTRPRVRRDGPAPLDEESYVAVESALSELLSAAGFLVETRRRSSSDEMVIELIGDDVEPLLANKGEGLNGLEVLTGRIASRRLGHPVYPRIDAEGFRAHQKDSLQELAQRSADEAKRTRRPQLLPPLSPGERRLVHLALAADPEVETESEGDGFLKRVAVRLKSR
jgi:spoIIIJ-associated protein